MSGGNRPGRRRSESPPWNDPVIGSAFQAALESERQELEDEMSDFKAYPVLSIAFVYNF